MGSQGILPKFFQARRTGRRFAWRERVQRRGAFRRWQRLRKWYVHDAFSPSDVFILVYFKWGKRERPSSKEGENRFRQAVLGEKLQTDKESQLAPSHAFGRPFRGKEIALAVATHPHHWFNLSGFLASLSQRYHPSFPNKSNFPRYPHDKKCDLCLEGCKRAIRGARVPHECERATVDCPSVGEQLSGVLDRIFFTVSQYLHCNWTTVVELQRERHSQGGFFSPASGMHKVQEGKVRLMLRWLSQSIYFSQSFGSFQV